MSLDEACTTAELLEAVRADELAGADWIADELERRFAELEREMRFAQRMSAESAFEVDELRAKMGELKAAGHPKPWCLKCGGPLRLVDGGEGGA